MRPVNHVVDILKDGAISIVVNITITIMTPLLHHLMLLLLGIGLLLHHLNLPYPISLPLLPVVGSSCPECFPESNHDHCRELCSQCKGYARRLEKSKMDAGAIQCIKDMKCLDFPCYPIIITFLLRMVSNSSFLTVALPPPDFSFDRCISSFNPFVHKDERKIKMVGEPYDVME